MASTVLWVVGTMPEQPDETFFREKIAEALSMTNPATTILVAAEDQASRCAVELAAERGVRRVEFRRDGFRYENGERVRPWADDPFRSVEINLIEALVDSVCKAREKKFQTWGMIFKKSEADSAKAEELAEAHSLPGVPLIYQEPPKPQGVALVVWSAEAEWTDSEYFKISETMDDIVQRMEPQDVLVTVGRNGPERWLLEKARESGAQVHVVSKPEQLTTALRADFREMRVHAICVNDPNAATMFDPLGVVDPWDIPVAAPKNVVVGPTPLVFIDSETTGLSPKTNVLIDVAAVVCYGPFVKEQRRFSARLKVPPHVLVEERAREITGYNEKDWEFAMEQSAGVAWFLSLLPPRFVLAGHNVGFDRSFLNAAIEEHGFDAPGWTGRPVDTQRIAKTHLLKKGLVGNVKLATVCEYLKIDNTGSHGALRDAERSMLAYRKMTSLGLSEDEE